MVFRKRLPLCFGKTFIEKKELRRELPAKLNTVVLLEFPYFHVPVSVPPFRPTPLMPMPRNMHVFHHLSHRCRRGINIGGADIAQSLLSTLRRSLKLTRIRPKILRGLCPLQKKYWGGSSPPAPPFLRLCTTHSDPLPYKTISTLSPSVSIAVSIFRYRNLYYLHHGLFIYGRGLAPARPTRR